MGLEFLSNPIFTFTLRKDLWIFSALLNNAACNGCRSMKLMLCSFYSHLGCVA